MYVIDYSIYIYILINEKKKMTIVSRNMKAYHESNYTKKIELKLFLL